MNTRRRNFDITVSANTYAGELKYPMLAAATRSNDTVAKGYVDVIEGIHYKAVLPVLGVSDPLAAATCAFTSGNDTSIGEKVLLLKDLQVNEEICRKTVYPTWHGAATGRANTNVMTPEFVNYTLAEVAAKAAESIEIAMWQGSGVFGAGFLSNDGVFDSAGLGAAGLAGATTVDIASLTASNTIEQLGVVYAHASATKPGIIAKPNLAFYVSTKTYALFIQQLGQASGNQGINLLGVSQNFNNMSYLGVPVRMCPGMFDDAIVLTYKENLVYGSNVGTDQTDIQWIPTYQYDGSDNIRIVMRFALGVQSRVAADAVVGATWVA